MQVICHDGHGCSEWLRGHVASSNSTTHLRFENRQEDTHNVSIMYEQDEMNDRLAHLCFEEFWSCEEHGDTPPAVTYVAI